MIKGHISFDENDGLTGDVLDSPKIFNHDYLYNRDASDAHPITAIEGLVERLTKIEKAQESQTSIQDNTLTAEALTQLKKDLTTETLRAKKAEQELENNLNSTSDEFFSATTRVKTELSQKITQESTKTFNQLIDKLRVEVARAQKAEQELNNALDELTENNTSSNKALYSEIQTKLQEERIKYQTAIENLSNELDIVADSLNSQLSKVSSDLSAQIAKEQTRAITTESLIKEQLLEILKDFKDLKTLLDNNTNEGSSDTTSILAILQTLKQEISDGKEVDELLQIRIDNYIDTINKKIKILQETSSELVDSATIIKAEQSDISLGTQKNTDDISQLSKKLLWLESFIDEQIDFLAKADQTNLETNLKAISSNLEKINTLDKKLTDFYSELLSNQANLQKDIEVLSSIVDVLVSSQATFKEAQATAHEIIDKDISELKTKLTTTDSSLQKLANQLDEDGASLDNLKGQFIVEKNSNETKITAINKDLTKLEKSLNDLLDSLTNYALSDNINSYIDDKFEEQNGHVNHLIFTVYEDRVADLESWKSTVANVMDFIGVTTTNVCDEPNTNPIILNSREVEAIPGDVVIYGNKEYVWTGSQWEEFGNVTELTASVEEHSTRLDTIESKYYACPASLIFSSLTEAENYIENNQAFPGMLVTVNADGLLETYILNLTGALELFSGGGGGTGSPDKVTATQYCIQVRPNVNFTFTQLSDFSSPDIEKVASIDIEKSERKNNTIITEELDAPGGYIYYISQLDNLKFTSAGFDAGFTKLEIKLENDYLVYRSNQKIIDQVEITIN